MQLLSPADAVSRVTAALKGAADATGAGFDYLLRTAQRESSLNPAAKASSSSARGLFQFIDQTWLQVLKEDGPKLGLAEEAADVTRTASGRYVVADPARRAELLALRDDPTTSALLAGAFTRRNAATLQAGIGRAPTEGELYAAHFLGAKGATELIRLAADQPSTSAASAFPAQASANRAIFYDMGRERTAGEVYARLTAGGGATATATTALALQETRTRTEEVAPFNAGVEDDGRAFHSLFKTGRRSPVSAYVAEAWSSFGAAGLVSDVSGPFRGLKTAARAEPATDQLLAASARAYAAAPAAVAAGNAVQTTQAAAAPAKARRAASVAVAAQAPAPASAVAAAPASPAPVRRAVIPTISPSARK
ncbi:lytic transglycosylase domain-containing protein [Methylopila turkensis]|uniref:Lytic transglycosylase domain-containing protein n=1 Tax=Methylopila turkensis TaxID=1437816 RepID=A0A9W6JRP2_9HYPH|nr:lytic transglycosylase domain-containing protein [Methylopila turkensis]GLK81198.1 hypothetical protein GCM10008174_29390 [Methylopila turkensis]